MGSSLALAILSRYWRPLAFVALVAGAFALGWAKGHGVAASRCHEAALKAEIDSLRRDLSAQAAATALADARAAELADDKARMEREISDYQIDLAVASAPQCRLDRRDVERLRRIAD